MTRSLALSPKAPKRLAGAAAAVCVASLVVCSLPGQAWAQRERLPLEPPPVPTTLPDPIAPLHGRDETIEDQMQASALFTEGRLLFRREAFDRALERYERAYRYANGSDTILAEIIPLAFSLGRMDEAARYARRATGPLDIDPFVWRRLALHLTERQDYAEALRLYGFASPVGEADTEEDGVPTVIPQFEMGRLLYLTERFDEAIVHLGRVSELLQQAEPPAAEKPAIDALLSEREITFALIAEAYLRANQSQRAAEMFRLAYRDEPDAAILDFHAARVAAAEQDTPQALERLGKYLRSGDTAAGTAAYELLVELRGGQGERDEALAELEQLAEQQAQNVFLLHYLGQLQLNRNAPDAAVEWFERLMAIRPLVDGYRGLLQARIRQQNARAIVALLADAVPRLDGLESFNDALEALVADRPLVDRVIETAEREFLAQSSTTPATTQRAVSLALAELIAHRGEPAAADRYYERAAGRGDEADPAIWLAWGMNRLVAGQPGKAAEVFAQLLERLTEDSQQGPVYFYLASALALDHRYDQALSAARRAAELAPLVPAIQMRPAWVLLLAKRWPEAAAEYTAFIERYDDRHDSGELREAIREAKTSLSSVCVYLGQNAQAERWLEEVLDEVPDDVGAHNDLGYLWADRGVHLERALRMTRYAVEREPNNEAYRDSYGWALFKLGKFPEAVEQLRKAAEGESPDGVILDHLGDALQATNARAAAADAWRRALAVMGENDPERRARLEEKIQQVGQP